VSEPGIDLAGLGTRLERYFDPFLDEHGPTARGVDWNSPEAQELRFRQLLKAVDRPGPFTINDYGCGYGALVDHLRARGYAFRYRGYDLAARMLAHARELHGAAEECEFFADQADMPPADFTLASGVLNLKLDIDRDAWTEYALETIATLGRLSTVAFAFNMLTSYSDRDRMRPDLYYGDPCFFFDHCKRSFSRDVALLHDYGAYEFTVIVRLPQSE
jgi:SAM-dependent methyltransferase